MSKIFRISGNFEREGKWPMSTPEFMGMILSDDGRHFVGYCYENPDDDYDDAWLMWRRRFIVGRFTKSNKEHGVGVEFFQMCNDPKVAPVKCKIPDLGCGTETEAGTWAWRTHVGFEEHGRANVLIEDMTYSKNLDKSIRTIFSKLNKEVNHNADLIRSAQGA